MSNRNYPAWTKGFYEEQQRELEKLQSKRTDVELIRLYLCQMQAAINQYQGLIETVLTRMEGNKWQK